MKRILVSVMTALGDNVCATAALGAIRKAYPDALMTVLAWKVHEFVFEKCPYVDEVITIDYSTKEYIKQWQLIQTLRRKHFDFAINLDNKTRSLVYMRLAGIKPVYLAGGMYGRVNFFKKYLLSDKVVMADSRNQTVNVVDQYLDVVEAITGVRGERRTNLGKAAGEEYKFARQLLHNSGWNGNDKLVALCIRDEKKLIKNWQGSKWAEVACKLVKERNCFCFTVGTREEYDYAQQTIEQSGVRCANFCGKTSIKQMLALLEICNVLIAPCSGTGHMAAAMDVPTIIVYTNSRIYTWALVHDKFIPVFSFVDCLCYTDNNDCKDRQCWSGISADDVVLAYDNMLEQIESAG